MRKIKVVVLLVQQLQHGFTKNAKVSPNLTVAQIWTRRTQPISTINESLSNRWRHYRQELPVFRWQRGEMRTFGGREQSNKHN